MSFANPKLIIVIIVPILLLLFYLATRIRRNHSLESFAAKDLLPKLVSPLWAKLRLQKWLLRNIGLFFLVLAIIGPQWGYEWHEVKSKGLEILIAFDCSKSMLAADVKPNRFEMAKLAVKDFLAKLPGNRVGLVAFAGSSFLQCPLTLDINAFNMALDGLSIQSIPRGGTAIGLAIATARQGFQSATGSKILILITDGENHEGDPVAEAKKAASNGIHIYTIGIGNPDGELIELKNENGSSYFLKDAEGKPVKTALNESILKQIAASGNGSYIKGDGISLGLEELYNEKLLKYHQADLTADKQKRFIDRYQIPLLIALVLFLLEISLSVDFSRFRPTGITKEALINLNK